MKRQENMKTELEIKLEESKYAIGRTLLNCSLENPKFANHTYLKSVKECNAWLDEDYRNQINFITK
tara:strand:- start:524 stop:721 length:198 start_codon:yes stop_codon:yes gene_type:complete